MIDQLPVIDMRHHYIYRLEKVEDVRKLIPLLLLSGST
jgi:hypothetical protein